jgi:hypothetical protein
VSASAADGKAKDKDAKATHAKAGEMQRANNGRSGFE